MIKRIPLDSLKPGMFVSSFDLSWFKHPFVTTRLGVIRDQSLIDELRRLGVSHVEVDTSLSVTAPQAEPPQDEAPGPRNSGREPGFPPCPPPSDPLRTARFAKKLFDQSMLTLRSLVGCVTRGHPVAMDQVKPLVDTLVEAVTRNENVLHHVLALKQFDEYTYTHSLNLGALSVMLGTALELPQGALEVLGTAGILHDVGKCLLPREIVAKPGPLTRDEFDSMKRHPGMGHEHLQKSQGIDDKVLRVVLEHHERVDGAGYPFGLSGDGINSLSSIVSVVDIYDALTSDRVYRSRVSPHSALRTLFGLRGKAFPETVVDMFIKKLGVFPALSVVQLKNGCYAWVTRQTPGQPLFPEVMVFCDSERRPVARRRVDTWRLCGEMSRKEFEILRPVEPGEVPAPDFVGVA